MTPTLHSPRAILFDLDGTLIDSVPLILDSFCHAFTACGLPVPATDILSRGIGTPLRPHFLHYSSDPEVVDRLVRAYREYNLAHHDARVRLFPGVREMLADIGARGVPIAIVTSKNRMTTARGLDLTGLHALISAIVTSDDVVHPKPHPEPVIRAAALLDVPPSATVFAGDSLHDLHSGRDAGARTAAVLWGPFGREHLSPAAPDYWIERPEDFCGVVGLG